MMTKARLEGLGWTDAALAKAFTEEFEIDVDPPSGDDEEAMALRSRFFDMLTEAQMTISVESKAGPIGPFSKDFPGRREG